MEEGEHRHASVAERQGLKERLVARCRVVGAEANEPDLQRMHSRFVDAQRRNGVGDAKILLIFRQSRIPSCRFSISSITFCQRLGQK